MESTVVEYAHIIIKLLQDVIYDEDKSTWSDLLTYQAPVRDYFAKIGVDVFLDEREGFAFLRQKDDENSKLPRLVRRTPLSYEVTLLCAMLREILEEFDVGDTDSRKCFINGSELREKIEMFFTVEQRLFHFEGRLSQPSQGKSRFQHRCSNNHNNS